MDKMYQLENFPADQENLSLQETVFHNANGYLGVRGTLEEGLPAGMDTMRGMYINGFYDMAPMKQAELLCNLVEDKEALINVADTQSIECRFGGSRFSLFEGKYENLRRWLNMSSGVTGRSLLWHCPEGGTLAFEILRMTSFAEKSLFLIDYTVTSVDYAGPVSIHSPHLGIVHNYSNPNDPRMAAESGEHLKKVSGKAAGNISLLVSETAETGLQVASAVAREILLNGRMLQAECPEEENPGAAVCQAIEYDASAHRADYTAETRLNPGDTLRFLQYAVFSDSRRSADCRSEAEAKLEEAVKNGPAYYYDAQRAYLDHFWERAGLTIEGDDKLNDSIQFNMYALLQSAGSDGITSIPAKGLSGEGYEGHYFWDTEMFMLPFFDMNDPEKARELLSYRYHTLPAARKNAKLAGHRKGALFPWRTITGRECSGYFPSGTAAYHINGAVAYAVLLYYLYTGDEEFMQEQGYELILETARLWMDVGNLYKDEFQINCVTGPDEYTCMINNNYYTNCCAKYNLEWVCCLSRQWQNQPEIREKTVGRCGVKEAEIREMEYAAAHMRLVYDADLKINPQDDSFLQKPVWNLKETDPADFPLLLHYHPLHLYRWQVCKQADTVLAHFLFPRYQSEETVKNSFRYYEKITTHDSSLSTCVFSIVASRLGLYREAMEYMGDSAEMDLLNTHHNSKDGIHAANMGGSYMAIVNGLGGLRVDEDGLSAAPYLPEQWKGYSFRVSFRGRLLEIAAAERPENGFSAQVSLLKGERLMLKFCGEAVELEEGSRCRREFRRH